MKKQRKLRRRLYSLLLCLLAVAVAVAAVAVGDLLESRYAWRADLSFNSVTTQSETTLALLRGLTRDVRAYAVYSEGNELADLSALLDRYQAATPHFTWSRESLGRNPLLLQWASDDVNDSAVNSDCLILRCEETNRTRVLTWSDYVGYGYNAETGGYEYVGLTYEKALSEAILYVTTDELPRVQILTGHGEMTESETAALTAHLTSANYETVWVNLRTGAELDPAAPLMILSPAMDADESEIAQLTAFAQAGGAVFVTVDFTDPDALPNLYAFYRLYGVQPLAGAVLADEGDRASYYGSIAELTPTLLTGSDAIAPLKQAGADFLIMAPARALEIVGTESADLLIDPVLESAAGAARLRSGDGEQDLVQEHAGPYTLAVLCDRAFPDGTRSRAFFIGNSGMFLDEQIYALTYSGELLLQVMQHLRGSAPVSLDIAPRSAARTPLDARGSAVPVILLTVPPLLIAVLAVAILLPRRYL